MQVAAHSVWMPERVKTQFTNEKSPATICRAFLRRGVEIRFIRASRPWVAQKAPPWGGGRRFANLTIGLNLQFIRLLVTQRKRNNGINPLRVDCTVAAGKGGFAHGF